MCFGSTLVVFANLRVQPSINNSLPLYITSLFGKLQRAVDVGLSLRRVMDEQFKIKDNLPLYMIHVSYGVPLW